MASRLGAVVFAASLVNCYRDAASPVANTAQPLVVASTPHADDLTDPPIDPNPGGRLRTHTTGVLSGAGGRGWAGPSVPSYVPPAVGTLELFLLDQADGGDVALYRSPYNVDSCQLGTATNCTYEVRFYDGTGRMHWQLRLNDVMSRTDQLEVQDLRLSGGVLYFNEACQSYAKEAGGACSSLVAVDPQAKRVLWRTAPLVSNGRFQVRGRYLIAGYGFTAEPDQLALVDRATGRVVQTVPVSSAPEQYALTAKDRLAVQLYSGGTRHYRLDGFDGPAGHLTSLDPAEAAAYGGAGYAGKRYGTYGGVTYGYLPGP